MLSNIECNEKLKALRALSDEKADLKQKASSIQGKMDKLNAEITEYFDLNEVQNIKLTGYGMFYIQRMELPQIEDTEAVKTWLAERGDLEMLMSFNTNKFRAYWKERNEDGEAIPHVNSFIKTQIMMRRG